MRAPNALLLAAQKTGQITPLVRLALTGASPVTYYAGRLLRGEYTEQVFNHKLLITLDNRDDALDDLNFKGYQADLSFGATVSGSPYYSQVSPLWVLKHRFDSAPKVKELHLTCVGLPNLLMEDRASANYEPDSDNTDTIETIFKAVANATLACFNHCDNITVTVDSRDALINVYIPKDAFRIYKGASRLAILRMLIDYTKCIMRFEADGAIHIRLPVVTGEVYDETYDFDTGGRHPFFSKAYSEALVIPNRFVVSSLEGDDPQYSGSATHAASYALLAKSQFESAFLASDAQGQAIAEALIAKAAMAADGGSIYCKIMNTAQELYDYTLCEDSRQGDSRAGNIGSLIRRFDVDTGQFDMTLTYGAWLSIRQEMNNLEAYPAGFGSTGTFFSRLTVKDLYAERILAGSIDMVWLDPDGNVDLSLIGDDLDGLADGATYARVKSLHMDAGQIVLDEAISYTAGFDPRDKFDLGDNDFDDIPEGSTYNRVLSTQINAGKILLSDQLEYTIGYNPSEKTRTFMAEPSTPYELGDLWVDASVVKRCTTARESGAYQAGDWTATTLDEIANGSTYKRVATAALSAGGLVLLDQVTTGTYGLVLAAEISAGHIKLTTGTVWDGKVVVVSGGVTIDSATGINIWGTANALTTRATEAGTIQCYVGADGALYAGAGNVYLDANGLTLKGSYMLFYEGGTYRGLIGVGSSIWSFQAVGTTSIHIAATNNIDISSHTGGWIELDGGSGGVLITANVSDAPSANDIVVNAAADIFLIAANQVDLEAVSLDIDLSGECDINAGTYIDLHAGSWIRCYDGLYPATHETTPLGASDKAWSQLVAEFVYSDSGNIDAYHAYDDLALLKGLKWKKNKRGRNALDASSLPQEMVVNGENGERFVSMGGIQGLSLGIHTALLKRIEALEEEVATLRGR